MRIRITQLLRFLARLVIALVAGFGVIFGIIPADAQTTGNGATFVSQTVPATMIGGETYTGTVTYENTGTTTWTSAGNYHLGAQNPQDNTNWGPNRAYIPGATASVAPGQSVTFTITITAPAKTGVYSWQWGMVQDGVAWFSPQTPVVSVSVTGQLLSAAFVSQSVPSTMVLGQSYPVTVTMLNNGNVAWTAAAGDQLGSQDPADNTEWMNVSRVGLPAGVTVAPGQSYTFGFTVSPNGPNGPGGYSWQWGMVNGTTWFGVNSPIVSIGVVPASGSGAIPTSVPALEWIPTYYWDYSGGAPVERYTSLTYYEGLLTTADGYYWIPVEFQGPKTSTNPTGLSVQGYWAIQRYTTTALPMTLPTDIPAPPTPGTAVTATVASAK